MIDPRRYDEDELLSKLRSLYNAARGSSTDKRREMSDMDRFVDGHQWPERDLRILRDQRRPALVMNMTAPKINSLVGMYSDTRMEPVVAPTGAEDKAKADMRNRILEVLRQRMGRDQYDRESYETHLVMGEASTMVEVQPDHDRPTWVHLGLSPIDPRDVDWDPAARRKDYSDADYVSVSRWIGKTQFLDLYPDKEDTFEELMVSMQDAFSDGDDSDSSPLQRRGPDDYQWGTWSRREKKQVRLVHMEWRCRVWRDHLVDTETGQSEVIEKELAGEIRAAISDGSAPPAFRLVRAHDITTYTAEFVGTKLLTPKSEILEERPFNGFSVEGAACFMERTSGIPYGVVRHLVDPQRDLNKAYTMSNESMTGQGRTGWLAEHDAIDSKSQFEADVQRSGGVALVRDMARVRERNAPQLSPALAERMARAQEALDTVSNVVQTAESPSRAQEAGITVALRERRSLRGYQASRETFDAANRNIDRRLLEVVARSMPMDQILALLSDPERYQAQGSVIVDTELEQEVDIKSLREIDFDLILQPGGKSDSSRLNELQILEQLSAGGTPVDPVLKLELAATTPSMRERLVDFAKQAAESEQQQAQAQMQMQAQMAQGQQQAVQGQVESMMVSAQAKQSKVIADAEAKNADQALRALEVYIQSYLAADEAEKRFVTERSRALLAMASNNEGGVMQ